MYKLFDCIAGTSFGGIIALGLTASRDGNNPLLKTEKLIKLFLQQTEDIFPAQLRDRRTPCYPNGPLQQKLDQLFKKVQLSDALTRVLDTR